MKVRCKRIELPLSFWESSECSTDFQNRSRAIFNGISCTNVTLYLLFNEPSGWSPYFELRS
jgi:hypothetical protein